MDGISILNGYFGKNGLSIEAATSYTFNDLRSDIPPSSKKSPPQSFVSKVLNSVFMRSLMSLLKNFLACFCCVPFSSPSTFDPDSRGNTEIIDSIGMCSAFADPISDLCSLESKTFIKTILNLELEISANEEELNEAIDTLHFHGGVSKEYWKKMVNNNKQLELRKVPWFPGRRKTNIESINQVREKVLKPNLEQARNLRDSKEEKNIALIQEKKAFISYLIENAKGNPIAYLLTEIRPFIEQNKTQAGWLHLALKSVITDIIEKGISGFRKTPESLLEEFEKGYAVDPNSTSIQLELPESLNLKGGQITCNVVSIKAFTLFKEGSPNIEKKVREVYLISKPTDVLESAVFKYTAEMY